MCHACHIMVNIFWWFWPFNQLIKKIRWCRVLWHHLSNRSEIVWVTARVIRNVVTITAELMKEIIGQCCFCNAISTVIKEITVNYQVITILNSDNFRLSKRCRETQITLFCSSSKVAVLFLYHSSQECCIFVNELDLPPYSWYTEVKKFTVRHQLFSFRVIHAYICTWSLENITSSVVAEFFFSFFTTNLAKQEVVPSRRRLYWLQNLIAQKLQAQNLTQTTVGRKI